MIEAYREIFRQTVQLFLIWGVYPMVALSLGSFIAGLVQRLVGHQDPLITYGFKILAFLAFVWWQGSALFSSSQQIFRFFMTGGAL